MPEPLPVFVHPSHWFCLCLDAAFKRDLQKEEAKPIVREKEGQTTTIAQDKNEDKLNAAEGTQGAPVSKAVGKAEGEGVMGERARGPFIEYAYWSFAKERLYSLKALPVFLFDCFFLPPLRTLLSYSLPLLSSSFPWALAFVPCLSRFLPVYLSFPHWFLSSVCLSISACFPLLHPSLSS